MTRIACGLALVLAACAPSAGAQVAPGLTKPVAPGQSQLKLTLGGATYADALACYQHYEVAAELARKLEKSDKTSADAAAGFQLQAITARKAQAGWSRRIDVMAAGKSQAQINADLKKISAPVIADANLALTGDKAAAQRTATRAAACAKLEAEAAPAR